MFVGSNALLKYMQLVKLFVNDYCDALRAKKQQTNKERQQLEAAIIIFFSVLASLDVLVFIQLKVAQ